MVQLQATIVSFLAAFVALLIDLAETKSFDLNKALVLISSSVVTANVACLLLGNYFEFNYTLLKLKFNFRFTYGFRHSIFQ